MDPSLLLEIFKNPNIFILHFFLAHRDGFPCFRIFLILEEIDTGVSDMRKSIMEESDRVENLSGVRVGEADDQIDIDIRMSCGME